MRQFIEVMMRLYRDGKVDEDKIVELFINEKITEEEKWYILNARKGL
jgi:hypothetical protein